MKTKPIVKRPIRIEPDVLPKTREEEILNRQHHWAPFGCTGADEDGNVFDPLEGWIKIRPD